MTQETNKPVLTAEQKLRDKIERAAKVRDEAAAKVTELMDELAVLERLANLGANDHVLIRVGRADTSREVTAVITGRADTEAGVRFKVLYGEGFETESAVIQPSQILRVIAVQGVLIDAASEE